MSRIYHPARFGPFPSSAEMQVGQPVYGRTLIGIANGINAGIGARFKRVFSTSVEMAKPSSEDSSSAANLITSLAVPWMLSANAEFIWVGMWLVAEANQSSAPYVTAALYSQAAVQIDAGVTWSQDNGLLPVSHQRRNGGWGVTVGRDVFVETGWSTEQVGAAGGGVRMLGGEEPGEDVELRFTFSGVRPYSMTIAEAITGRMLEH